MDKSQYSLKNLYSKARELFGQTKQVASQGYSNLKGNVQALSNSETRKLWTSADAPVSNAIRTFSAPAQQMGQGVGGAIRSPFDLYFNSKNAQIDQRLQNTLRNQQSGFMKSGDLVSARDRANKIGNIGQQTANRQIGMGQQLQKDQRDAALGTVRSGIQLLGSKGLNVGSLLGTMGLSGGIGYGATRLFGGSNQQALNSAGSSMGNALTYRGINKISDKLLTNPIMSRVAPGNMGARVGFGAGANALANLGEDEVLARTEDRKVTNKDRAISLATGAVMGGVSQAIQTKQYLKQVEKQRSKLTSEMEKAIKEKKSSKELQDSFNKFVSNYDEPISKLKRKMGVQTSAVIKRISETAQSTGKVAQSDIQDLYKIWADHSGSPKLAVYMTPEEIAQDLWKHGRKTYNQGGFIGGIDDTSYKPDQKAMAKTGATQTDSRNGRIAVETPQTPMMKATAGQLQMPEQGQAQSQLPKLSQNQVIPETSISSDGIVAPGKIRGLVSSVQEADNISGKTKMQTQGTYTPKPNDQLMGEAKALLQNNIKLDTKNVSNIDQKVAATIQEAINQQAQGNHQAAANLFNNLSEQGTELGRGVQAFSLLKNMTPESIALSVAGKIKKYNAGLGSTSKKRIPELTGEQVKLIADKLSIADGLGDREKQIALNELNKTINNFIPSSIAEKAITLWKAGLLTSLRTHERNLIGNTIHQTAEVAKDFVASPVDALLSLRTGKRTLTATTQGLQEGISKQTGQQALDLVKLGYDPSEQLNKFDYKQVNWGNSKIGKAAGAYTNAIFRTLGAADKPFYNAAMARSLYDQAGAEAINQGKRGNKQFIEALVKSPTENMIKTAISDANMATFKNETMASNVANSIKRSLSGNVYGKLAGEFFMPFTGVPSSVFTQLKNYSPIGLTQGIIKSGKVLAGQVPELQRQAAQEVGRGAIGTGIFGLGAYLMSKGLVTGQPKDAEEQRQWDIQNKPRNSILINGKWRSLNSIGPEAFIFLSGAKLQEEMTKKDGSLATYAGNIGKDMLDQSFVTGIQQPVNAITDPGRYGKSYIGNSISSVIPNVIKDTAKAFDSTVREANSVMDYAKMGVPGLRNTLLEKRDALGNVMQQEPSGPAAYVDLFNSKTPISNPVVNELARLNTEGYGATPSKLTPEQTINKKKHTLTPEQLNVLEAGVGETLVPLLEELMATKAYQGMTDDKKQKTIDQLVTNVRSQYKDANAATILSGNGNTQYDKSADSPINQFQRIGTNTVSLIANPVETVKLMKNGEPIRKVRLSGSNPLEQAINIGDAATITERAKGISGLDNGDKSTQIDHIVPKWLGGRETIDNYQKLSNAEHASITKFEADLLKKYEAGDITKAEALKQRMDFNKTLNGKLVTKEEYDAFSIGGTTDQTTPTSLSSYLNDEPISKTSTPEEVAAYYLQDVTLQKTGSKYQDAINNDKMWTKLNSLSNRESLTDDQKAKATALLLEKSGIDKNDYQYYQVAKQDTNLKTMYALEEITKIQARPGSKPEDLMNFLKQGRYEYRGNMVLSSGVIDNLVDEGILTYSEGKSLKKYTFDKDPKTKTLALRKKKTGNKVKKPKKISLKAIKVPKIKVIQSSGKRFDAPKIKAVSIKLNPKK